MLEEKIIDYIQKNRVSTTEVSDCLGKRGVLPNVLPINAGKFCVGKVKWVYAYKESNYSVHEQIREVEKDSIVFIEAFECGDRAIVGELVAKYLLLYSQITALITNGKMRDAHRLIKEDYPIWCAGVTPVGCFNNYVGELDAKLREQQKQYYDNTIAVCDDSGVVIIPHENINMDFYNKLVSIEQQEDIWFECIDCRKWNTFDTVCKKKYIEGDVF